VKEEKIQSTLKYSGAVFLLVFSILPYLWMVLVSLGKNPDFLSTGTGISLTLSNYSDILTAESFHILDYLRNSLIISAVSALSSAVFASFSAYAITRLRFPGRILIPVVLLGVSMFPQISIVGYLFRLMTSLGWINTYYALVFPYTALGMPLALWIMLSYFSQIPIELDKAGLIDGASRFQILRRIIFPVALPGIFSALLLAFIFSFNEFMFSLMLTIDYNARTIPVGIALFQGLHGEIPWGYIMASSVVATVPIILLALAFQKYIIEGLSRGAVKG
jgi:trehalose/maltose transport system permease protein